jgi:hypothetical protein
MAGKPDLEGMAHRLALIASATSDADTSCRLLELVEELLEQAGLPPDEVVGDVAAGFWAAEVVKYRA